ncbi:hypothetical protein [Actinophytocola sediminis]
MLYIVLALVLGAFGLLIAALTTANTIWAWISVSISVVAAALLIADWVSARRKPSTTRAPAVAATTRAAAPLTESIAPAAAAATTPSTASSTAFNEPVRDVDVEPIFEPEPERAPDRAPEPERLVEQTVRQAPVAAPPPPPEDPAEEPTDAADLLVVSELTVEVKVVDEHPRYHLGTCGWLADRPTLPLPVNEARQLGFTPCAYCGPDAVLAARHRAAR